MNMHDFGPDPKAELKSIIDRHGWAVRYFSSCAQHEDTPPFAYTVGMTGFGHPEFVMTGMPHEHAHVFLNHFGRAVRDGRVFRADTLTTDFTSSDAPLALIEALDTTELYDVRDLYGRLEALQIIWCDSGGLLPWQPGYNNAPEVQPFLGLIPESWDTDNVSDH